MALSSSEAEREAALMLESFEGRHEKLQAFLLTRFGHVSEHLITDRPLPSPLAEACAGWGTEVRAV